MLVWLASYPRSGNTFLRTVLKGAFNLASTTIYGADGDKAFWSKPALSALVGTADSPLSGNDLIESARASDKIIVVKTHDPPLTDDPAIYVMRDGRSAVVSYFHFIQEVETASVTLEKVIRGEVYAGSWSDHLTSWNPGERPKTLPVRYEDLSAQTPDVVARIGEFLNVRPTQNVAVAFESLQTMFPEFFRSGSNQTNVDELERDGANLRLFEALHGPAMRTYGYA